jgi:microcystin-dependent protein
MAVLTETNSVTYNCNGSQVVFPITFPFADDSANLAVILTNASGTETTLTITTDYTVSGSNLTTVATYASGYKITIQRDMAFTQGVDWPRHGPLDDKTLERALDKLTLMCQQLKGEIQRNIYFPVTESFDGKLPPVATRASQALCFDVSGAIIAGGVSAAVSSLMQQLVDDTSWAQARRTLWNGRLGTVSGSDYTVLDNDGYDVIQVSPGAASRTVLLPTLADNLWRILTVKKVAAGTGGVRTVTVDGEGSETIDGNTTYVLRGKGSFATFMATPTQWTVIARSPEPGDLLVRAENSTTPPDGYLLCDGSAISRTTYDGLFEILGITHGQGDGSTTFNIPDYRGRFLRGKDGGTGRDPNAATRTAMATGGQTGDNVGSVQDDSFQAHLHQCNLYDNDPETSGNAPTAWHAKTGLHDGTYTTITTTAATYVADGSYGTPRYGAESRPKNAYVNYFIKY